MANVFSGSEVVELGIQIEKNGKDFYDELLKKSKNEKAKKIFQYLRDEEERHIAAFQEILNSVHKYEPPESYPGEYFAYMNALASEYVFTKKDRGREVAQKTKNDKEAVELGIGFEKDSILFYEGMKKVVPESQEEPVDGLIEQERSHLCKLYGIKNSLK